MSAKKSKNDAKTEALREDQVRNVNLMKGFTKDSMQITNVIIKTI